MLLKKKKRGLPFMCALKCCRQIFMIIYFKKKKKKIVVAGILTSDLRYIMHCLYQLILSSRWQIYFNFDHSQRFFQLKICDVIHFKWCIIRVSDVKWLTLMKLQENKKKILNLSSKDFFLRKVQKIFIYLIELVKCK